MFHVKHTELVKVNQSTKVGNHRAWVEGSKVHCVYYSTEICTVDHAKRQFATIDRKISTSTSIACGKYRNELNGMGYTQVEWGTL